MEKAGLGAGFFLLAMGCGGMDFRKYAVAAVGSDGFAAFLAFEPSNSPFRLVVG